MTLIDPLSGSRIFPIMKSTSLLANAGSFCLQKKRRSTSRWARMIKGAIFGFVGSLIVRLMDMQEVHIFNTFHGGNIVPKYGFLLNLSD
jgi:hypothetical protein